MNDMISTSMDPCWDLGTISQSIMWQPPYMGVIIVELFASIRNGLVALSKLGLIMKRYIHVDNALVPCGAKIFLLPN